MLPTKEAAIPAKQGPRSDHEKDTEAALISRIMLEINMTGTESITVNFAAKLRVSPTAIPAVYTVPVLDMPGSAETA